MVQFVAVQIRRPENMLTIFIIVVNTDTKLMMNIFVISVSLNQNGLNSEVEQVILDMVNHENFRQFVMDKVNTKVDVSALEEERERIRKLLRQVMGAKAKLTDMLEKLDVMDKHYDRKYQDMHDRLDK